MATYRADAGPILTPEQVANLLVLPTLDAAVAGRMATRVNLGAQTLRVPRVTADPTASWVAEGQEIAQSDADFDEITVSPPKVAGLTVISRELADDSTPAAAQVVGAGLARDIARRVDEAFFGDVAAPGPPGLGSLTGTSTIDAPAAWNTVDPFEAALFAVEGEGGNVTAWAANPADALALSLLKEATGSNRNLLQPDPTQPSRRVLAGRPLYTSPYVPEGTVYGTDASRVLLVVRDDAEVTTDRSIFFTSDRVAVRATMRVGFAFVHAATVVAITRAEA